MWTVLTFTCMLRHYNADSSYITCMLRHYNVDSSHISFYLKQFAILTVLTFILCKALQC